MYRLSRLFCGGSNRINSLRNSCHSLYTLTSLGIDRYIERREKVKQYYLTDGEAFREKMKSFVVTGGTSATFTEVLKRMVHLTDCNEEDLQLLEEMLRKFKKQCQEEETRSDNFIFGPVVMRLLHHINKPDLALKLFKDPELDGFFDQLMSYHILCDMLYEKGCYRDVMDVYEIMQSRLMKFETYPRHVVTLVFAACYKENTVESFEYCTKLFMELNDAGYILLRRAVAFAAALALKQDAPDVALDIVEVVHQENYDIVQSIKVEAFVRLGQIRDATATLRRLTQSDPTIRCTITKDSLKILSEAVHQTGDNDLIHKFDKLQKMVIQNGHVDDKTLDNLLASEIDSGHDSAFKSGKSTSAARYNNSYQSNRNQNPNEFKKPQRSERTSRSGSGEWASDEDTTHSVQKFVKRKLK